MMDFSGVFFVIYPLVVIGVTIYLIVLAGRFVDAHQRAAEALERISHTLRPRPRE
jgi:hypothetical protein